MNSLSPPSPPPTNHCIIHRGATKPVNSRKIAAYVDGLLPGTVPSPFLSSIRVLFTVGGGHRRQRRERRREGPSLREASTHRDSRRTTRRAGYFFSRVIGVQASLCNWYRCVLAVISPRSISRRLREPLVRMVRSL